MRTTYADLVQQSEESQRPDRVTSAPLLGFVIGVALALLLWSAIGWLIVAAVS